MSKYILTLFLFCSLAYSQQSGGGVRKITAGTNVTISPVSGVGNVTVNASGGVGSAPTKQITIDTLNNMGEVTSFTLTQKAVFDSLVVNGAIRFGALVNYNAKVSVKNSLLANVLAMYNSRATLIFNVDSIGAITTGSYTATRIDSTYLGGVNTVTAKTLLIATRYNTYDIQISADTLTRSLSFATDADRTADSVLAAAKVGGSGTANTLAMFTATSTVGNSTVTQASNGDNITFADSIKVTGHLEADGTVDMDNVYTTTISTKANVAIGADGRLRLAQDTTSSGGNPTKGVLVDTLNNTGVTSSIDFSSNIVTMAAGIFDSMKTNIANDQYMKNWQYRVTTVDTTRDPTIDSIAHQLTFALDASSLYEFEYELYFTTGDAANGTGVEVLASCASAPTTISAIFAAPLNAGAGASLLSHDITSTNTDTARSVSGFTNAVPMPHTYRGRVLTNAATALKFSFQAEEVTPSSYVTLKRGSYGRVRKLYP